MKVERGQAALITGAGGGIGLSFSPSCMSIFLFHEVDMLPILVI